MPWFNNRSGECLWYDDQGCGTPLVFLHGWCMSSVVWGMQTAELSKSFRVIALDLRGHGLSGTVASTPDFEHFANDLCDLIQLLDLSNVILIGWSMGGQVALQAASGLVDRLAALALVSATPCFVEAENFPYGLSANEAAGMRLKLERSIQRALKGTFRFGRWGLCLTGCGACSGCSGSTRSSGFSGLHGYATAVG
jgi:pimeloyl-ACP methyl ester carboxylesterase